MRKKSRLVMEKTLIANTIFSIAYRMVNILFPLITSMVVSRALLPEGIGKVSATQNIVKYFTYIAAMGIPTYGIKAIAATKEGIETDKKFSELFYINAASSLFCTLIYYGIFMQFSVFDSDKILYIVTGLTIPLNIINIDWYYQGKEDFGYILVRSIIVKIIAFIMTVFLVKDQGDVVIYAAIIVVSQSGNYLFNIWNAKKSTKLIVKGIECLPHLRPIFILLASSVAIELYTMLDTTMLNIFHEKEVVGYYTTAMRAVSIVRTLLVSLCTAFLPRMSSYYAEGRTEEYKKIVNKGLMILISLSVPAASGCVILSNRLVPLLFGESFSPAIVTMSILSFSIITVSINNYLGNQVLVSMGMERKVMYSTIVGAVVSIVMNFLLIIPLKQNGSAIASVVTETVVTLFQIVVLYKTGIIKIKISDVMKIILAALVMVLVVKLINRLIQNILVCVLVSVVVGISVYLGLILIMNVSIAKDFASILRKQKRRQA